MLAASDGLFDNLYEQDIERITNQVSSSEGLNLEKILSLMLKEAEVKSKDPMYLSPFARSAKLHGVQY